MKAREKRPRKIRAVENSEVPPPGVDGEAESAQEEAVAFDHPIRTPHPRCRTRPKKRSRARTMRAMAGEDGEDPGTRRWRGGVGPGHSRRRSAAAGRRVCRPSRSRRPSIAHARQKAVLESLIFVGDRTGHRGAAGARDEDARRAGARAARRADAGLRGPRHRAGRGRQAATSSVRPPRSAPFVREFVAQKPVRLTRAQLETLALVAYRQPITRPEIDDVRGVDSGSALRCCSSAS